MGSIHDSKLCNEPVILTLANKQLVDIFKLMLFANDSNGVKTYIDETKSGQEYCCPICEEKLIRKFGKIRTHHFAHANHSECRDSWHYDMSEWHSLWQSFFPKTNQEVVFKENGKAHRADVCVDNLVVEFQHSKISPEEFCERNSFYHSLGKKIIWVFDLNDKINEYIERKRNKFELDPNRYSDIFDDKNYWSTADAIFLCEEYDEDNNEDVKPDKRFAIYQVPRFKTYYKSRGIVFDSNARFFNAELVDKVTSNQITWYEPDKTGPILELWRNNNVKKWGVFRRANGWEVLITSDPEFTYNMYNKRIYGRFSAPGSKGFSRDSREVYGIEDDWELIRYE